MAKYVFKLNLGLNPMNLVVASLFFSLVCVSLGTAVNSYAKDLHKAGIMSSLLLSPMCMLGGCWWPLNIMPKFLQDISNFIPTTWIMKSYNDLLVGKNSWTLQINWLCCWHFRWYFPVGRLEEDGYSEIGQEHRPCPVLSFPSR